LWAGIYYNYFNEKTTPFRVCALGGAGFIFPLFGESFGKIPWPRFWLAPAKIKSSRLT
jgi:hypothetical protein